MFEYLDIDINIVWRHCWTVFNIMCFVIYLGGVWRCLKQDHNRCSTMPKLLLVGCGIVLFSYAFRDLSYLVMSGGDYSISFNNPKEVSINTFNFLYIDTFEFFRYSGFILIVVGMLSYRKRMKKNLATDK